MYARQRSEAEREDAERLAEQLSALAEAAESLTFTADHEALLERMARGALRAFPFAGRCVVFIYDEEADELVPGAAIGYDLEALSAVRLRPGQGVAGKVFATGKTMISSTPQEVAQHLEGLPAEMRRSLLAARHGQMASCVTGLPLHTRGQTIGCLILECIEEPYAFSEAEEKILYAFASYMAVVLENARLMREASQAIALAEANRAKTEFLSYVTHEIHTPLAAIKIAADTLMLSFGPREASSPRAKLGNIVARNTRHLERLLEDMLSMTRLQTGILKLSRQWIDIREVVDDTVESVLGLTLTKHQSLRVNLPPRMPLVNVDKARLKQILSNLLVNASRYTPRRGSIEIAVYQEDATLVMSVSDTGRGLPKEAQERIFEKFYRLPGAKRRDQTGLGLGLPIAKALVELHGGRIWLESKPGEGSTFFISIPKVVRQDEGANR